MGATEIVRRPSASPASAAIGVGASTDHDPHPGPGREPYLDRAPSW